MNDEPLQLERIIHVPFLRLYCRTIYLPDGFRRERSLEAGARVGYDK
jgi:hypothetical protein